MTDRTSELVAEFSKEIDARTYDLKMKAVLQDVIDQFDGEIDAVVSTLLDLARIVSRQGDRITELESLKNTISSQGEIIGALQEKVEWHIYRQERDETEGIRAT